MSMYCKKSSVRMMKMKKKHFLFPLTQCFRSILHSFRKYNSCSALLLLQYSYSIGAAESWNTFKEYTSKPMSHFSIFFCRCCCCMKQYSNLYFICLVIFAFADCCCATAIAFILSASLCFVVSLIRRPCKIQIKFL